MRDLTSPRRDPNPLADLNEELRPPPATEALRETPAPGTYAEAVEHVAAMIAGMLAGAMPMIMWSGTFDENRLFDPAARTKSTGRGGQPTDVHERTTDEPTGR